MKKYILGLLLLAIIITSGGVALASDITGAMYRGVVQATNSSTAATNIAVPFTANTTSWIANGILNATATNVVAQSDTDADIPFMPGYGSNPWILFYDSISASSDRDVTLYLGDVSGGDIAYFPGSTGMSIADHSSLEPGNSCNLSITTHVNTAVAGVISQKNAGGNLKLLSDGAGKVTATDTNRSAVTISYPITGLHWYQAVTTPTTMSLIIDGVTVNSTAVSGSDTDYADAWQIGSSSTLYITSANITISGTLKGSWNWEYGATFTDDSGNGRTGTPTFRTTSSDADVSAELTMFAPIDTATVDSETTSSWPSIMAEVPEQSSTMYSENTSPGIFFAPLVETFWPYSGLPNSFFWYCFAFVFIVGAGILVYAVFASKGYSAMLIKVIVMMAVMIFFSVPGTNIYGGYVPIYFGMWCFGILVLSKSYGW
jgi:hypothetical protein